MQATLIALVVLVFGGPVAWLAARAIRNERERAKRMERWDRIEREIGRDRRKHKDPWDAIRREMGLD